MGLLTKLGFLLRGYGSKLLYFYIFMVLFDFDFC